MMALAFAWMTLVPSTASADGPTTFSNSAAIAIPASGSANQIGPGAPYPSTITVSGLAGAVTTVTATFAGLTHGSAGDIDALLVAPTGANLMLLSDIGTGTPEQLVIASNDTLTFSDSAASSVPAVLNLPSGTFRPTNSGSTADTLPAPSPTPSNNTTLAGAFTGINPNGIWRLFVADDTTGDVGEMTGGWSLTITTETAAVATSTAVTSSPNPATAGDPVTFTATVTAGGNPVTSGAVQFTSDGTNLGAAVALNAAGRASLATTTLAEGTHLIRATYTGATGFLSSNGTLSQRVDNATVVDGSTFCNTGAITVPGQGPAQPYPSNIRVTGLSGQVTKVVATLKGVTHQAPIDLDVLLAGPTPTTNLFLLSDAGGQTSASNVSLTFDDGASSQVPSPLMTGTYRPTRVTDQSNDAMPAPAPAPSSASTLATFNGSNPNGTWSLWVVDDASADSGSISGGWCLTVTSQVATTTTLTSSGSPSQFGDGVTFTATVRSAGSPVNAGSVQFTDGAAPLGPAIALASNGTATFTTSALAGGTHTIHANYSGTATLAGSTAEVTQTVDRRTTSTEIVSSDNPSTMGDPVTFTASVTTSGTPVASGTVTFSVDGNAAAPVPLDAAGSADFTVSSLDVGTHPITAVFSGNANDAPSQDEVDQVVQARATATALTSSPNPSTFGQSVTLTATVTSGGSPVTSGTVQFADDGTDVGVPVSLTADGTATLTTAALSVGSHPLTAHFAAFGPYGTSADDVTQVVNPLGTTTVVLSGGTPSDVGDPVSFTATVRAGAAPVGAGSVEFSVDGDDPSDTVALAADGTAVFTTADLTAGDHVITARFTGTALYEESSGTTPQTVRPVADAGGPYSVVEGESLTLDASGSTAGLSYGWGLNADGGFTDATGQAATLTWAQLEALGIDDGPSEHQAILKVSAGTVTQTDSATLSVTNARPATVVTGALRATAGVPFTVKVGADDPSAADMAAPFTYTIDWGDGSSVQTVVGRADPPVTHTYAAAGSYAASLSATDKDGGTGDPTSVTVSASPAAQTPTPSPSSSPSPTPLSPSPSPTPSSSTSTSAAPTAQPSSSEPTATEPEPTQPEETEPESTEPEESEPEATDTTSPEASPAPTSTDDALAHTGAGQGLGLATGGAVLVVIGIVLLALGRRRGLHE